MSYEGHEQYWCPEGHYWEGPCTHYFSEKEHEAALKCPDCGKTAAFVNAVDDTNCDCWGEIRPEMVTPAQSEICNLGHRHETVPATYKIPTEVEWKLARKEGCYCPPGVECDGDRHLHPKKRILSLL